MKTPVQIPTAMGPLTVAKRDAGLAGVQLSIKPQFWPSVGLPLTPKEAAALVEAINAVTA